MTVQVVWLPRAAAELQDAMRWYAAIRLELADRFAQAVEEVVEAIAKAPSNYAVVDKGRRRAGVSRFPYGLFFIAEEKRVVVIACFHGKRNPKQWRQRRPY